jgi:gluconolactonase
MLSFVRMDPNSTFPIHNHPEHQLMMVLRGALTQAVMDSTMSMTEKEHSVLLMPGGMVHSATMSEFGGDALDIFWPVRPDYIERAQKQNALYRQVVTPETKPTKLADGFTFTEGVTWLKGKLYVSDMYFKDPAKGDWTGSPARSRLIVMEPDGKWKVLSKGMQTNGTIASREGNLLVCDMFGHRVIEMDTSSGKVLRTVLDKINGKPIDGPNDLVMDAKGGVYVSDPQFTPEAQKSQPGKQVYYIAADGTAKVVIPAGEYAMPNGVEISPDGKTFYVNNTWLQPGEDFLYAYDVQPDGSLTKKRKFAKLHLTDAVLSAPDPINRFDSRADGMTVDLDGRIYVATLMGVQIFDKSGVYVGTIWCPQYPVNITFGGKNGDILYMVGEKEAWSVQTKVKGFRLPAGLD